MTDRPILHMMIGLPYSGKSTLAKFIAEQKGIEILSFDEHVQEVSDVGYNETFSNPLQINKVKDCFSDSIVGLLKEKKSFVLDQPNITWYTRRYIISSAKMLDYEIIGYVMPHMHVKDETRHEVGDKVIDVFKNAYQEPHLSEGFDHIFSMGVTDVIMQCIKEEDDEGC